MVQDKFSLVERNSALELEKFNEHPDEILAKCVSSMKLAWID